MSESRRTYTTKSKTIFRIEKNKDNPYVMIDRRLIENPLLSWKAKGLLAYLLSRPDDWTVRFRDLVNRAPDGAHTIRAAMKELRKAGHVKVTAERERGRVKQWVYTVYELPDGDFQQVEKQQVENRTLNNNDSIKENKGNDIKEGASAAPRPPKAQDFPTNILFREVTEKYPPKACWHLVLKSIHEVEQRLLRPAVKDDLFPFYEAWIARGFSPVNLAWLTDWAVNGKIPQKPNGNGVNKTQAAIQQFLNMQQQTEVIDVYAE